MQGISSRPASAAVSNNSRFIEATRQNHAVLSQAAQEDTAIEGSQLQAMVRRPKQLQVLKASQAGSIFPLCFPMISHRHCCLQEQISPPLHLVHKENAGEVPLVYQLRHQHQLDMQVKELESLMVLHDVQITPPSTAGRGAALQPGSPGRDSVRSMASHRSASPTISAAAKAGIGSPHSDHHDDQASASSTR